MKRFAVGVIWMFGAYAAANAAVPSLVNYQGILKNASDVPQVGTFSVSFSIYSTSTGGSPIWTETQSVTTDTEGLFNTLLGSNTPLTTSVFSASDRYLGTAVSPDGEMTPRTRISAVAYAFRPATVDGATGGTISGMVTVNGGAEGVRIHGTGVGNPGGAYVSFTDAAGVPFGYVGDGASGDQDMYVTSYIGDVHLYTPVGAALTASSNGNVGIGSTAPGNQLSVVQTTASNYAGNFETQGLGAGTSYGLVVSAGTNSIDAALKIRNQSQQDLLTVRGNGDLVMGTNFANAGSTITVEGGGIYCDAFNEIGLTGASNASYGVWGIGGPGNAGQFSGNVNVSGTLTKSAGSFKIDHPLDPANKYLSHSFVESPDMKNMYDGVATLDARGEAAIDLSDWFGALNKDFRYQLTAIGAPGPNLYVAQEIAGNQFRIAGGTKGMKVSWQVTGIRKDAYANAHRIPVEEAKPEIERGFYCNPELFSQPVEKSVEWARHPEVMKQRKDAREKAKDNKR